VAGVVVGAVVGLALMAGCAGGATEQGTGEGAPAPASPAAGRTTPASPVPATGSAPGSAQVSLQVSTHAVSTEEGENVIWFAVEGGFAHQLRELVVAEDGTTQAVVSGRPSTGHLAAAALARIRAELDGSGLFGSGDHEYPPGRGADLQRYEIRYAGSTVVAYDSTVPGELTTAIQLLQQALLDTQG
jgi:hypothetical protein